MFFLLNTNVIPPGVDGPRSGLAQNRENPVLASSSDYNTRVSINQQRPGVDGPGVRWASKPGVDGPG